MIRAVALAALLALSGCGSLLCPDGYEPAANSGTYGVWKCEEERS